MTRPQREFFGSVIEDVTALSPKIPQSAYLQAGRFPVVDQGASPVAGYTNDASMLATAGGPVIAFGDHTRRFKYVDFPFAVGADGVKLLKVSAALDPKYVFHFLSSIKLPNAGYSRHFKYLREVSIPLPPLPEQRRIAAILDNVDVLKEQAVRARAQLDEVRRSAYRTVFGSPRLSGAGVVTLESLIDPGRPLTYGILMPGPNIEGGVPYVRVTDMRSGQVALAQLRRTTPEIAAEYKRSTLEEGDLLLSIRGHVGRTSVVPEELHGGNITQDTARLALQGIYSTYVNAWLAQPPVIEWLARHTKGAAVRGINLGDLRRLPVAVPTARQQRVFDETSRAIGAAQMLGESRLCKLDELFASLQHRAFNGEL